MSRQCAICGCTEEQACLFGCGWADDDVCTACKAIMTAITEAPVQHVPIAIVRGEHLEVEVTTLQVLLRDLDSGDEFPFFTEGAPSLEPDDADYLENVAVLLFVAARGLRHLLADDRGLARAAEGGAS